MEKLFSEICGDDNEIDAYELKQILDKLLLTIGLQHFYFILCKKIIIKYLTDTLNHIQNLDEPTKDSFKKKAGFFNIFSVFCKGPVTRDEMVPMVPLVSPSMNFHLKL